MLHPLGQSPIAGPNWMNGVFADRSSAWELMAVGEGEGIDGCRSLWGNSLDNFRLKTFPTGNESALTNLMGGGGGGRSFGPRQLLVSNALETVTPAPRRLASPTIPS